MSLLWVSHCSVIFSCIHLKLFSIEALRVSASEQDRVPRRKKPSAYIYFIAHIGKYTCCMYTATTIHCIAGERRKKTTLRFAYKSNFSVHKSDTSERTGSHKYARTFSHPANGIATNTLVARIVHIHVHTSERPFDSRSSLSLEERAHKHNIKPKKNIHIWFGTNIARAAHTKNQYMCSQHTYIHTRPPTYISLSLSSAEALTTGTKRPIIKNTLSREYIEHSTYSNIAARTHQFGNYTYRYFCRCCVFFLVHTHSERESECRAP